MKDVDIIIRVNKDLNDCSELVYQIEFGNHYKHLPGTRKFGNLSETISILQSGDSFIITQYYTQNRFKPIFDNLVITIDKIKVQEFLIARNNILGNQTDENKNDLEVVALFDKDFPDIKNTLEQLQTLSFLIKTKVQGKVIEPNSKSVTEQQKPTPTVTSSAPAKKDIPEAAKKNTDLDDERTKRILADIDEVKEVMEQNVQNVTNSTSRVDALLNLTNNPTHRRENLISDKTRSLAQTSPRTSALRVLTIIFGGAALVGVVFLIAEIALTAAIIMVNAGFVGAGIFAASSIASSRADKMPPYEVVDGPTLRRDPENTSSLNTSNTRGTTSTIKAEPLDDSKEVEGQEK